MHIKQIFTSACQMSDHCLLKACRQCNVGSAAATIIKELHKKEQQCQKNGKDECILRGENQQKGNWGRVLFVFHFKKG